MNPDSGNKELINETTINSEFKKFLKDIKDKIQNIDDTESYYKIYNDLLLYQKQNQSIFGVPGANHELQKQEILKNSIYWEFQNILRLLEIKKVILDKGLKNFASFSAGGSIGAGYLGFLYKSEVEGTFPDVIFGTSAGALYPAIYLLWKKAKEINPEKSGTGLNGIFDFLPNIEEGKTMWSNGEDLINNFAKTGQYLIDIINEKSEIKLPNIEYLKIQDISDSFAIISSRKIHDKKSYQEVIFSGKDNLINSIIASSNPELNILGINFSVLTSDKNNFYNNSWYDGYHVNPNPAIYCLDLGLNKINQYSSFFYYMFRTKQTSSNKENPNKNFFVPKLELFLSGKNGYDYIMNGYDEIDQNDGWEKNNMQLRILMSYYGLLSISNIGLFLVDVEKYIHDKEIKDKIFDLLLDENFLIKFHLGDIDKIQENINLVENLKGISKEQKETLINKLFYINNNGKYIFKYDFLKNNNFKKLNYLESLQYLYDSFLYLNGNYEKGIFNHININELKNNLINDILSCNFRKEIVFQNERKNIKLFDLFIKLFSFTNHFDDIKEEIILEILLKGYKYEITSTKIEDIYIIDFDSMGQLFKELNNDNKQIYLNKIIKIFETTLDNNFILHNLNSEQKKFWIKFRTEELKYLKKYQNIYKYRLLQ